ncbi:MAG: TIGR04255 family protein [Ferruginibacter sp.]
MQYSNKHLVEVNCGFHFPKETTQWDSTFFGRFYEKIINRGFTEKEERKGFQLVFGMQRNRPMVQQPEVEDQVIFKNKEGMAILMGKNRVSFHVTQNYTVWNNFVDNFIKPYSEIYKTLGLGNGERGCNLVYLNRFNKSSSEPLSEYFKLVTPLDKSLGTETNTVIHRVIDNGSNLLISKFQAQLGSNAFNINFECGAQNKDTFAMNNPSWIEQANKTHGPVNDFFESLITEKLRKEL